MPKPESDGSNENVERCPCGRPLHYTNPEAEAYVRKMIQELGPNIVISTPFGSYEIPRHFIALHGIKAQEIQAIAIEFGFKRIKQ